MKEFKVDNLKVKIADSRAEMGKLAAADIRARMLKLLAEREYINVIFAAAPSQNETLASLLEYEDIDWTRVNAFHMDEYVGLPKDAPQRFGNYLTEHIFAHKPFRSINFIDPSNTAEAECARYTELLTKYPVDIVILGIGENGHIAFNDPGVAKFDDPETVKIAKLDEVCRNQQVNDGCFASIDLVPTHAYTLTVPIMMSASKMMLVVPTALKAKAIHDTVLGPVDEMVPASIVRTHKGGATLYTDEAGAFLI